MLAVSVEFLHGTFRADRGRHGKHRALDSRVSGPWRPPVFSQPWLPPTAQEGAAG